MKTFLCLLLVLSGLGHAAMMTNQLVWGTDYEEAVARAAREKKPLLLDFSATWCGPCRMMETTTFSDASVVQWLEKYVPVRVDLDRNPALAARYHVTGVPAFFVLNQFGETVSSAVGYRNPEQFIEWLKASTTQAFAATSRAQAARAKMEALDADLHSADPAQRQRGLGQLLESYATQDDAATLAQLILKQLANERPAELLPQLNDRRLAVRILIGNLLAQKLGETFAYDPWGDPDARAATVQTWTQKLSGASVEKSDRTVGQ